MQTIICIEGKIHIRRFVIKTKPQNKFAFPQSAWLSYGCVYHVDVAAEIVLRGIAYIIGLLEVIIKLCANI